MWFIVAIPGKFISFILLRVTHNGTICHERNAECPLQQWLSKRAIFLHYTCIACLVNPGSNQETFLCSRGRGNVTARISDSMELLLSCLSSVQVTLLIYLSFNSFSLAFGGMYLIRDAVQASLYQKAQAFQMALFFYIINPCVSCKSSHKMARQLFDSILWLYSRPTELDRMFTKKFTQNITFLWKAMKYNFYTVQQWDRLPTTSGPALFLMKSVVLFLSQ